VAGRVLLAVGWEASGAQGVLVQPQAPPARWALLWAHSAPQLARGSPRVAQVSTPAAQFWVAV